MDSSWSYGYGDMVLLSPTPFGLQQMLHICERYAKDHDILFNTRSGRVPRTTPSGRGGRISPPIKSQLLLKLERRKLEGRWRPQRTLLCVHFMTLGQYLKGQMRSNVVKFAILATILRLYADNSKSSRPIFPFLSLYDRAYILE